MEINFLAVVVVAIIQMVIGMVWYGPLFGKVWSDCMGMKNKTPEEVKAMQKAAAPLYAIQFLLSLLMNVVLAGAVTRSIHSGSVIAFVLWLGFVMPVQAGGVMWDNLTTKVKVQRFLISTGYQLVTLLVAGLIFERWM